MIKDSELSTHNSGLRTWHSALCTWVMLGLSILLWSSQGVSQERPQLPQRPPPSDFNIQLDNFVGPSYVASVPGAGIRSGLWANGNLHRLPGWKPSEAVPDEVSVLRIEFWLEEGTVRIEVMAYLGQSGPNSRPPDWEKLKTVKVVSRLVREDETINVSETERFGIEPFSVKVSRSGFWSIGIPEIINKTQALTVSRITEERPDYTVTVRNVSHKHISAISWHGLTNGRNGSGSGMNGWRVIGAGMVFEIHQRFNFLEARPEEADTEATPKRAIVIAAIVFEDGTFEGEANKSAELAASIAGHRIQYLRAISLLRDVSLIPGSDQLAILSKLKRDIASLNEDSDQEIVKELATRFATASEDTRTRRIKEEVSNSLKSAKTHLLGEIEKFEYQKRRHPDEANLELWLKETIEVLERSIGI